MLDEKKKHASNDAQDILDKEEIQEEGKDLCSKCGNLMVEEGGEKVCSSCSEDIDFFGDNTEPELPMDNHK